MDFIRKDPNAAYFSNVLYLPKAYFAEAQLAAALTYDQPSKKEAYVAYEEDIHHFIVPRNYISPTYFSSYPFPVIDARIRRFPRVQVRCNAVLDLKSKGLTYQRDGADALLACNQGVLTLACGKGKTVTSIHAVCQLQTPALVIVTDGGLAQQWIKEIVKFTNLSRDDVGLIGDGKFVWKKAITVAIVHSLAGRVRNGTLPHELVQHFGVVVADEAHTTAGPAFYHLALTPFHGRRWGLSATPYRTDGFRTLLQYTLGPVVYKYLFQEIKPLIYFRQLNTELNMNDPDVVAAITDCNEEIHLSRIYGYLATREDRTRIIIREVKGALSEGRHVLLLSQSKPMLKRLGEEFPNAGVVHGEVSMRLRDGRVQDCNPVIAISRLGRQALDKTILDTLMVCEPYSDAGVLQQLIGRIQRPDPAKKTPVAVFYEDVNIQPMHRICKRIRKLFSHWPEDQGGQLRWQVTGDPSPKKSRLQPRMR